MIRAACFDLDDTLVDRSAAHRRFCREWLTAHRSSDATEAVVQELMHADRERLMDRLGYFEWWRVRFGLHDVSAAELWSEYQQRLPALCEPLPGAVALLTSLRKRLPLACVSDGSSAMQRAKLDAARLADLFDVVLISGEVGYWKPDLRLFEAACTRLDVRPEAVIMFGDRSAADLAPARTLGMTTVHVTAAESVTTADPDADFVIDSLEEALSLPVW